MHLAKVCVRNFRNLKDLKVSFGPGLNVLVGVNNIGKTNLLDAIRVGLGPAACGPDTPWINEEDLFRNQDGSVPEYSFRIDLYFEGLSGDEQGEFLDILNYNGDVPEDSTASIHFEATWSAAKKGYDKKRWGGERPEGGGGVPEDILESIPVTLLGALRDAERGLRPGRNSRLGALVQALSTEDGQSRVEQIVQRANNLLERTEPLKDSQKQVGDALKNVAGADQAPKPAIRTSEARFKSVANSLRLLLKLGDVDPETGVAATEEIHSNGLGYNNLLYIATVVAQLESTLDTTLPLFLIEEPEAHLHPQMQVVLARFLESKTNGNAKQIQSIVTTHSPTISSSVPPASIRVLHDSVAGVRVCRRLVDSSFSDKEIRQVQRVLDLTRAALLFSRGVIFVEGISEALLVPVFARLIGKPLEDRHISLIQVGGVGFTTFSKLFGEDKLGIPMAIVTDSDPIVTYPDPRPVPSWSGADFERDGEGNALECARVGKLREELGEDLSGRLFASSVTLEYDLALAGEHNAKIMCDSWHNLIRQPETFNRERLGAAGGGLSERAMTLWRGVCVASPSVGKAELAHELADQLSRKRSPEEIEAEGDPAADFVVPPYLIQAISTVYDEAVQ